MRAFLWTHTYTHTQCISVFWVKKLLIFFFFLKRSPSKQDQKWGFLRCLNSALFSLKTLLMDLVEAGVSQWSDHSVRAVWSPGQGQSDKARDNPPAWWPKGGTLHVLKLTDVLDGQEKYDTSRDIIGKRQTGCMTQILTLRSKSKS